MKKLLFFLLIVLSVFDGKANVKQHVLMPVNLKAEYLREPIGLDVKSPRLSWQLNDDREGACQYAYQILISNDSLLLLKNKSILWNSGKVVSDLTSQVIPDLECAPRTKYYWKVRCWDKNKKRMQDSQITSWETGLGEEWKGHWITDSLGKEVKRAPLFRKTVELEDKVRKARAYICGLGYYELYINGGKIGDHILDPAFTRFDKKAMYVTYDVTSNLMQGQNTLGVMLGNGWYNIQSQAAWDFHNASWRNRSSFILNVFVEYESGKTEWIVSDSSWQTGLGAITYNNLYSGEYYDARKIQKSWNKNDFKAINWKPAVVVACPSKEIIAQSMPPIRVKEAITPVSCKILGPGMFVYDLGRNIAGVCKFIFKGIPGTKIRMKHGEKLYADGRVDMSNIDYFFHPEMQTEELQTDSYIIAGEQQEEYIPHFTYHGFRYVEIIADKPIRMDIQSVEGLVVYTDLDPLASFSCSNDLLNKIYKATNAAYVGNLHSIPTDCPTREKNGWTADAYIAIEHALFNFDGISLYEKWIRDFYDVQTPDGQLPDIVPTAGWGYPGGNPAWDIAFFGIPNEIYMFYGDATLLKESYPYYKKYLSFIGKKAKNNLLPIRLWDWGQLDTKTPVELTSSCFYFMMVKLMVKSCLLNGAHDEAEKYEILAAEIKKSINESYFDQQTGKYANGSQTAQSLALLSGIVPEREELKVASVLANSIIENNYFLDFGLFGSKAVLNMLSKYGYQDIAYKMVAKVDYPSWGYWIENKQATTLVEGWAVDGSQSLNHVFLGEISAWMIKTLAGINYMSNNPGFKKIHIKPLPPDSGLDFAEASFKTMNGIVCSGWKKQENKIVYSIVVPPNTTAFVELCCKNDDLVFVNENEPLKNTDSVYDINKKEGKLSFNLKPGKYIFSSYLGL